MEDGTQGWNIRNVRYEEVHRISPEMFTKLAESLELQNGDHVLDLMCGYGAVTKWLWGHAQRNSLHIHLSASDAYSEQLERIEEELGRDVVFRKHLEDARDLSGWKDETLDKVVIKQGLHEVPAWNQQQIVNEVYRILKPGGIFSLWDVLAQDELERVTVEKFFEKKDRIAGLARLAEDRSAFREDQAVNYLESAGFENVEMFSRFDFRTSTGDYLADFGGDTGKVDEWNAYIKGIVPLLVERKFEYRDLGDLIEFRFNQGIIRGRK